MRTVSRCFALKHAWIAGAAITGGLLIQGSWTAQAEQILPDVAGLPAITPGGLKACPPETLAYIEVEQLALQFGDRSDVFDDSLEQISANLSDCLEEAGAPASLNAVYKHSPKPQR
jgi:hypothetical protein